MSEVDNTDIDLLLVDSRHMLWRAASVFYDLSIQDKDGTRIETGGIYGWLRITMSTRFRFGGIALACWDMPEGSTERRKLFPEYKRKPVKKPTKPKAGPKAPNSVDGDYDARGSGNAKPQTVDRELQIEAMRKQEIILKQILSTLGVRQASAPGWEADDVIATLVRQYSGVCKIGILSGDRDLLQLVQPNVRVIRPLPKGQFEVFDEQKVITDFGLMPQQILDLKALAGDASDNIPGAKGIGPVSATKLIQEHKTWQQCLTWATNSTQTTKLAAKLEASRGLVELSAQLVKLNSNAHLEFIQERRNSREVFLSIAKYKLKSLVTDGRMEQLMALGTG